MAANKQQLDALQDIKQMMERSSRFISLSGLSGVAAGCCALVGAWFAYQVISGNSGASGAVLEDSYSSLPGSVLQHYMGYKLFMIALLTFVSALTLAFVFTYLRSKKTNTALWGSMARRLMFSVSLPMAVGAVYLFKLIENGAYGLIAPGCLIFYGLGLVNAGKYTLGEVKYLGYGQLILGILNCWFIGYGLIFWAAGFGLLHIVYGAIMWNKYERNS